jgi:hypothetical protein
MDDMRVDISDATRSKTLQTDLNAARLLRRNRWCKTRFTINVHLLANAGRF